MRGKKQSYKKMTLCALFLAASVIISIIESLSGINSLIPFPGVRLGLCNVVITACFYLVSYTGTLAVVLVRPVFMFLFMSNPVSFAMSLCGSILSYLSLILTKKLYGKVFSFCGISCISALFHSIGQIIAAMFIMGDDALLLYLPLLCALSALTGTALGAVMNPVLVRLEAALGKERPV